MADIVLDRNGDILVSESGDIFVKESVRQEALIRLKWILNEWRFNRTFGFPWFEDVLVKNPNLSLISREIEEEVNSVDGVEGATVEEITVNSETRKMHLKFSFYVGSDLFEEEETLWLSME